MYYKVYYFQIRVKYVDHLTNIPEYKVNVETSTLSIYNLILNQDFLNYSKNELIEDMEIIFYLHAIRIDKKNVMYLYPVKFNIKYNNVTYQHVNIIENTIVLETIFFKNYFFFIQAKTPY